MVFYEKKKFKKILFGILIILPFMLTSFYSREDENELINNSFTKEALIEEIKCQDFKFPDLILAQTILESGHFKSAVFKQNNNLFGMRLARVRYTLANGSNLNHATYDNWKQCVEDRLIYDNLYLNNLNRKQYKKYLDRVYATGKNYSSKLETIIKQNNVKEIFE